MSSILSPNQDNVKLYLPFSEGSGTTAYDYSGEANNGTITGATYVKVQDGDYALDLNGSTSYMLVDDSSSLDITNDFTILIWIYQTENTAINYQRRIIGKPGRTNGISYHPSQNSIYIGDGTTNQIIDTITRDVWHLIVYTQSASVSKVYIDKVLKHTGTLNIDWNNTDDVYIGGGDTNRYLNGLIRLPVILNTVVTQAFIDKFYQETFIQ